MTRAVTRHPAGADLPAVRDVLAQQTGVLVVDVDVPLLAERADLLLAEEVRNRLPSWGIPLVKPRAGIRATVIGASQYTIQVSGSTIYLSPLDVVPIRNVPVIEPDLRLGCGRDRLRHGGADAQASPGAL